MLLAINKVFVLPSNTFVVETYKITLRHMIMNTWSLTFPNIILIAITYIHTKIDLRSVTACLNYLCPYLATFLGFKCIIERCGISVDSAWVDNREGSSLPFCTNKWCLSGIKWLFLGYLNCYIHTASLNRHRSCCIIFLSQGCCAK